MRRDEMSMSISYMASHYSEKIHSQIANGE